MDVMLVSFILASTSLVPVPAFLDQLFASRKASLACRRSRLVDGLLHGYLRRVLASPGGIRSWPFFF